MVKLLKKIRVIHRAPGNRFSNPGTSLPAAKTAKKLVGDE